MPNIEVMSTLLPHFLVTSTPQATSLLYLPSNAVILTIPIAAQGFMRDANALFAVTRTLSVA